MFRHLDVNSIADSLDIWVTTCKDFLLRQEKQVLQKDGSKSFKITYKDGVHVYIPNIVPDRRKLFEIRNEAFEAMESRFMNTSNNADSKIDCCIYKKNGILLIGSSKREQNRTAYILSTC